MARDAHLSEIQRDAIWKWRWLGFANSTPAFKGSLVILAVAAATLVAKAAGVF